MEIQQAAEKDKQVDINSWSELDSNLLGEILSRLCLTDQARFRVVCKNWLAAHPINTKKPLPWYISFDRSLTPASMRFEFQLYDPSSPDLTSVHSISLTKLGIQSSSHMNIAATVKHNWLFICTRERRLVFWDRRYFVLFSPFTRNIITLPRLNYQRHSKFLSTFSTQPDSPDCVFFLLDTCNPKKIVLLTYRNGDREWTAKRFSTFINFVSCFCRLIYLSGMLYIVTPYGPLVSYNIVGGKFKFERIRVDELLALNFRSLRVERVFEMNGELMILYLGSPGEKNVTLPGKQCIRKYDWSNKTWIPVSTLGDKAIFVSDKTDDVATIDEIGIRNNGVLSNKIYHFFDDRCLVYSIEDGELVEFKSTNSNSLEDGGNDLSEYKNTYGITFSDTNKSIFWLEPPCASVPEADQLFCQKAVQRQSPEIEEMVTFQ